MSLSNFSGSLKEVTEIGSMLFVRHVSGVRVVVPDQDKTICDNVFKNFGSHSNEYPCAYLTSACAIGIAKKDIDCFIKRLSKVLSEKTSKIETPNIQQE
jgi:O-phospho-L-seryl-tRNASec:L-selenocysteinyl-tRNA synthase